MKTFSTSKMNISKNHHNIAIIAVPLDAMEHCIIDLSGKTWKTLKGAILAVDGVTHVRACKRTTDLGNGRRKPT
jgi:hypothetical protein